MKKALKTVLVLVSMFMAFTTSTYAAQPYGFSQVCCGTWCDGDFCEPYGYYYCCYL